jgi:hypothetical protein
VGRVSKPVDKSVRVRVFVAADLPQILREDIATWGEAALADPALRRVPANRSACERKSRPAPLRPSAWAASMASGSLSTVLKLQPSGAQYVPLAQVQLPGTGWQ